MEENTGMAPAEGPAKSDMQREKPDVPEARKALVKQWNETVQADKVKWKSDFDRMREDMRYARVGAQKSWSKSQKYVANIIQRHVGGKVAALYAKNPKVVVSRRKRADFKIWDGNPSTLQLAMQTLQMAPQMMMPGMMPPPEIQQAYAMVMDAAEGTQRRQMMGRVANTLQLLVENQIAEQNPPLKRRMKKLVRRGVTCGIGYVKLGFQRKYQKSPETVSRLAELESRLAVIERLMKDVQDGEVSQYDAEIEQLRLAMQGLQSQPEILQHEGLVLDYPAPWSIIPDQNCEELEGFIGCGHVTEEFMFTIDQIKEIWGIDMTGASYRAYVNDKPSVGALDGNKPKDHKICVWLTYCKRDGLVYTHADGYCDFLEEPAQPPIVLERFWPWFQWIPNDLEDETTVYPPSDVFFLRPQQNEYNRARQSLREHRRANRPKYAAVKGKLSDDDKEALKTHPENAVIELDAMNPGEKVDDVLQPVKVIGVDPNMYEVESVFADFQRVGGSQEANLGGVSGGTATESNIAETSRMSGLGSNIDDLDDMLSELFRAAGQVLLAEMSEDQVFEIVGPGAVWPEWTMSEIASEIYLQIEAGSSGRPNRTLELNNFKEIAPLLIQVPGISPAFLAREGIRRMDDRLDIEDALDPAMPAIAALNRMMQGGGMAGPANDPNAQGDQGADNGQKPPGSQNTLPAPGGQPQREGGARGGMAQ